MQRMGERERGEAIAVLCDKTLVNFNKADEALAVGNCAPELTNAEQSRAGVRRRQQRCYLDWNDKLEEAKLA